MKNVKIAVAAALAVAGVATSVLLLRRRSGKSPSTTHAVQVSQLWVYPVKSLSGSQQPSVVVGPRGVEYDREWAIFRKDTLKFCSQRELPKMKLLQATISWSRTGREVLRITRIENGTSLREVAGAKPLFVPIRSQEELQEETNLIEVDVWNLKGRVIDEGAEASAWLSQYLGEEVFLGRIVVPRYATDSRKDAPRIPADNGEIRLQDFSPLHLCSEEGFQFLQKELNDPTIATVQRFRPNIVVSGGAPYPDEDTWELFCIGDILMKTVKLCSRCSMPTITDTADRTPNFMPTAYLKEKRSVAEHGRSPQPMFGLAVFLAESQDRREPLVIHVGDSVTVLSRVPEHHYRSSS